MEENRIPKRVLYMNLGTIRLRGRSRNRLQDKVREDGRIVGEEGWQEKVHNREEWKKLLRTARNCGILHMPMEWMNKLHKFMFLPFIWRYISNVKLPIGLCSIYNRRIWTYTFASHILIGLTLSRKLTHVSSSLYENESLYKIQKHWQIFPYPILHCKPNKILSVQP